MACYHPLTAWYGDHNRTDKKIVFNEHYAAHRLLTLTLPCGQCWGCRLEGSRQWAIRCVHEASLHEDNCFITLTYNPASLPENGTLVKKHFQDFMKRLRKKFPNKKIRYYHCGEYGDKNLRPHYHAIIFGLTFDDLILYKVENGENLYTSVILEKIWGMGFATVGSVTFRSAAYVARYIMKKVNGQNKKAHYERVDPETGEIIDLQPEYTTMSRRPGIASGWYDKYKNDVYPSDNLHLNGKTFRPPKYYDRMYEHESPEEMEKIKALRLKNMKIHAKNNTPERLKVREAVKIAQTKSLIRTV
ncbi:Phage DNA replication protein |nr:Phage DNA replication protein \